MNITEKIDKALLNEGEIFWDMVNKDNFRSLQKALKNDDQSDKLFNDICKYFFRKFQLKGGDERAFNRLMNLFNSKYKYDQGGSIQSGMLRNQIFKIANELGMKLPSSSF